MEPGRLLHGLRVFDFLLIENRTKVTPTMQHANDNQQFRPREIVDAEIIKSSDQPRTHTNEKSVLGGLQQPRLGHRNEVIDSVEDRAMKPSRDIYHSLIGIPFNLIEYIVFC